MLLPAVPLWRFGLKRCSEQCQGADFGSPADGVQTINAFAQHVYKLYGKEDRFRGLLYPGIGHV